MDVLQAQRDPTGHVLQRHRLNHVREGKLDVASEEKGLRFQSTPVMPTYLICVVIGHLVGQPAFARGLRT